MTSNGIAIDLECRYRQTIVKTADSYEAVAPPEHRILKGWYLKKFEFSIHLMHTKRIFRLTDIGED